MHFINNDGLISKIASDAVKVNWNSRVAVAVVLDPVHIAVEGVKTLHQTACAGIFHFCSPAGFINQLQFIDPEGNEIGHIGGCRIAKARIELDALPFRGVVAGGCYDKTGNIVLRHHLGLIISQGGRRYIPIADMQAEAISKTCFGCPTGDHI